jgi:phosphoribosyl-AMP cyclohydrolase / phosphoribosyl-ATP pyrophosphohydrolase
MLSEKAIATIKWDEQGLIPAIIQDSESKQVLMMAYMNTESLKRSLELGETVFWSRSRQAFWHKGETSGNIQEIKEIRIDCDADTLLILVKPAGASCHTGKEHCFYRTLSEFDKNPTRD